MMIPRKLPLKEVQAFRKRIVGKSMEQIRRCTVCFYGLQSGELKQNGSGVLFQIGDSYFILTAAHVIDYACIHGIPYYIGTGRGKPISLSGLEVAFSPFPEGRDKHDPDVRDYDPFDVGFLKLSSGTVDELRVNMRFARLHEVDLDEKQKPGCYCMLGFPLDETRTTEDEGVVSKTLTCVTDLLEYNDSRTLVLCHS